MSSFSFLFCWRFPLRIIWFAALRMRRQEDHQDGAIYR